MANELTFPILPCPELDDAVSFYVALGFERAYRQTRPNPYAVVVRDDLQIHLSGLDDFDPGGNWLRFYKLGDTEEEANREKSTGLARVIDNAARQGDSRGDEGAALRLLDRGLGRFPDAPAVERVQAHLYRAELAVRLGDRPLAADALAAALAITLSEADLASVGAETAHAREVVDTLD